MVVVTKTKSATAVTLMMMTTVPYKVAPVTCPGVLVKIRNYIYGLACLMKDCCPLYYNTCNE